ncbi:OmpA family protein [candidate division KSB1 bacterium]|nr:OmpA family protein [candidate division KSB1 bacterium]
MSTFSTVLIIAMVFLLGFAGYYYLDEILPLKADIEELKQENRALALQVEQLEQKNAELAARLEEQVQKLSERKQQEINQLKATYEKLISEMNEQVEKGEVTITRLADQLKVNIVDRIIFPSGKAELSEEGINVLTRVGDILKQSEDKQIKVAGHTDNVPIHPNLQDKFASNWELSVARATNVVRFLHEEVGLDAKNLEAAGYAHYRPIASNKTKKGRARNRRIEILLLPKRQIVRN